MVRVPFQLGRSTRRTRRRRWVLKCRSPRGGEGEAGGGSEVDSGVVLCGAATTQKENSPLQYYVHRMWLVGDSQ